MRVSKNFIIGLLIFLGLAGVVASSFFVDYRNITSRASKTKPAVQVPESTTPPQAKIVEEEKIKFVAVGDFDSEARFDQTLTNIKKAEPAYTLALGDLSYGKIPEQQWCDKVNSVLGNKPFEIVPGNHDIEPKSQLTNFSRCLPNRINNIVGSYPDRYYFDKGKTLRTIVISPDVAINGNPNKFNPGSEELLWVEKILQDAKEQKIRWVVVAMHKNCLTIGEKTCEIGQTLNNLLIKNNVDLILQGHEHNYMRSDQLALSPTCLNILPNKVNPKSCTVPSKTSQYDKGNGSILAIVGTGGAELRDINKNSASFPLFSKFLGKFNDPTYGVLVVEVSNNKLSAKMIENTTGTVKDTFTIDYKITP
ncbi:hypothetical protein A3F37_02645 [Candidatus Saccharibacteria bacterium RIFCSPHIGHO2_12_FULL_41_12]|nr:MAG: hypothetical protein A3F37_02645 [Candidatus Saccharibacteria bacterium RIFCSPHIGHO2_12_FULL_41_12]